MAFNINKDLNFGLFSVSKKIGPVSIVLDKVFRKEGPSQEEAAALAAANDAARKRRINETGNIPGWPFRNHAQELRRTRGIDQVMVIPRMKFTFLVEFRIDQDWLNSGLMVTNLKERELIRDGSIYIPVKSIDHPQVNFEVETLRSANRYVKVPKRMEYQPATVTFDDDVTSMIAALRKEYIHFYHYAGDVGQKIGTNSTANLDVEKAWDEFQYETTGLVAPLGEQNRSRMEEHPSIGLKMRSDCSKHFFKEIVIYDLGVHPDSINAYYFYHPVVTSWTHDNLDYEDRQSKVTMSMQYEYESYYDVIGQNNSKVEGILFQMFGIVPTPVQPSDDHATMVDPIIANDQSLSVCSAQQPAGSTEPNPPQQEDCTEFGSIEELQAAAQRIESRRTPSAGPLPTEDQERLELLQQQIIAANDCQKRQTPCPPAETADAAQRTADATGATPTDPAAAAGSDTSKCRQSVGITATDRQGISSESNALTGQARDAASAQLQALSDERSESLTAADTALQDIEILNNMQQSGGTEGSQNLSREALELLQENGGDVAATARQRDADAEAALTNAESLQEEIGPLAGALNATGGPVPQPPPEPEPVQRTESQQRIEGSRRDVSAQRGSDIRSRDTTESDLDILNRIKSGETNSIAGLSAATADLLSLTGDLDETIAIREERLDDLNSDIDAADERLAELDEKVKAP